MTTADRIDFLGEVIEHVHFTGAFNGVAVAIYRIDGAETGTHFTALFDPEEAQVMAIQSEAEARDAFRFLVDGINAEQAAIAAEHGTVHQALA